MTIIKILLALSALYSGGMYAVQFFLFLKHRAAYDDAPDAAASLENHTFHLGLCFILSLGFLGLILPIGG